MNNPELIELTEKIVALVDGAGINKSVMIEAKCDRHESAHPKLVMSYLVSIFHGRNGIHQYYSNTSAEALAEAEKFLNKYESGEFEYINTYQP